MAKKSRQEKAAGQKSDLIQTCEHCRFFLEDETRADEVGTCRRLPPVLFFDTIEESSKSAFASVHQDSWCGEFRALENALKG